MPSTHLRSDWKWTANTGGLSARYGGEEFAVVLPGVSEERPVKVADAIRLLVTRLHIYHPGAQRQYVTISVGIAAKSDATADELRLTRDADIALYTAKEHGRDCTIASSTMVASRQEVTSLASSLPDMERAQLSLTLPGLEAAACDHLSRRRFCFDGLCEQNGVRVWLKSVRRRTAPAARTGLFSNITPRSGQPQAQDAFLIGGARQPLMRTVYESQYGIGGRAIISQKITSTAANAGNPKANHHRKSR
ncbi:diguanylate cyclase [Bradyrhizobium sp. CW11]|nr:diguanylate cyclase [Bradyrhizobium sp. CW11]